MCERSEQHVATLLALLTSQQRAELSEALQILKSAFGTP
jgi:hypothetical protein